MEGDGREEEEEKWGEAGKRRPNTFWKNPFKIRNCDMKKKKVKIEI